MKNVLASPAPPAIICALAVAWIYFVDPSPPDHHSPPEVAETPRVYTEQARALLGGLDEGDEVEGGWIVQRVYGPYERRIVIELQLGEEHMDVFFAATGVLDAVSPLRNPRFEFYHTEIDARILPPGAVEAAVGAISVRITDEPTPDGM